MADGLGGTLCLRAVSIIRFKTRVTPKAGVEKPREA